MTRMRGARLRPAASFRLVLALVGLLCLGHGRPAIASDSCRLPPAIGTAVVTAVLQAAIDHCAGYAPVHLTLGDYVSGPLNLKSGTRLEVAAGARLVAATDPALFPPLDGDARQSLLNGSGVDDVVISGGGVIDGNGQGWWREVRAAHDAGEPMPARPRLIELNYCRGVRLDGVTLENSPSFHLVLRNCDGVEVSNIHISAPADSPNTDGIDPVSTRNLTVTRVTIDTGDDDIAIKAEGPDLAGINQPSAGIRITDSTFLHGHGVSIGSDTRGGVHDITIQHVHFDGTEFGFRIKSARDRGGEIDHVSFRDVTMHEVGIAIEVVGYYPSVPRFDTVADVTATTPDLHDITVANVDATVTKAAMNVVGLPEQPFRSINLDKVTISGARTGTVRNASVCTRQTEINGARATSRGDCELS